MEAFEQAAPHVEPMNLLSCQYCKKRKLKCDRRLPVCGRCTESNRECDYPGQRQTGLGKKTHMRDLKAKLEVMGDQVKDLAAKYDALLKQQAASPANNPATVSSYQRTVGSDDDTVSTSERTHTMSDLHSPASTYPDEQWTLPQDTRQQLTDIFFDKLNHTTSMILRERYLESLEADAPDPPPRSLQLIIMALAANIDTTHIPMAQPLYLQARAAAEEDDLKPPSLAITQAWLLISHFESQEALFARASTSCSKAIRAAQVLGLHQLDRGPGLPAAIGYSSDWTETEARRRTWWAAFVSDRLIFATTGIPPMIRMRDIDTLLPCSDEAFFGGIYEEAAPFEESLKEPTPTLSPLAMQVLAAELFHQALDTMSSCVNHGTPSHAMETKCWRIQTATENSIGMLSTAMPASLQLPDASRSQQALLTNTLVHAAVICLQKTALQRGQMCPNIDRTVLQRSREKAAMSAGGIVGIFRLSHDLQVSLRNPVLCFAAFTAGLVCLERILAENDPGSHGDLVFLLSILNAVSDRNAVAGMLANQLVEHASSIGLDTSDMGETFDQGAGTFSEASQFAGQLAAHFVG